MAIKYWTGDADSNYSTASNWSPSGAPTASDDVIIEGKKDITGGLNQSAVALNSFFVGEFSGVIASRLASLQINCTDVKFGGTNNCFIDVGAAVATIEVSNARSRVGTKSGLTIDGSAIATIEVIGGSVEIVDSASVINVNVIGNLASGSGADVLIGENVTVSNVKLTGGKLETKSDVSSVKIGDGEFVTSGVVDVATLDINAGQANIDATGTITTLSVDGGTCDLSRTLKTKTITSSTVSGSGELIFDTTTTTTTAPTTSNRALKIRNV